MDIDGSCTSRGLSQKKTSIVIIYLSARKEGLRYMDISHSLRQWQKILYGKIKKDSKNNALRESNFSVSLPNSYTMLV